MRPVAPPRFVSLLNAHLAEQRRRNAEDVATLQRLVVSGDLLRPVMSREAVR